MKLFESLLAEIPLDELARLEAQESLLQLKIQSLEALEFCNLNSLSLFCYETSWRSRLLDMQLTYLFQNPQFHQLILTNLALSGVNTLLDILKIIYLQNISLFPFHQKECVYGARKQLISQFVQATSPEPSKTPCMSENIFDDLGDLDYPQEAPYRSEMKRKSFTFDSEPMVGAPPPPCPSPSASAPCESSPEKCLKKSPVLQSSGATQKKGSHRYLKGLGWFGGVVFVGIGVMMIVTPQVHHEAIPTPSEHAISPKTTSQPFIFDYTKSYFYKNDSCIYTGNVIYGGDGNIGDLFSDVITGDSNVIASGSITINGVNGVINNETITQSGHYVSNIQLSKNDISYIAIIAITITITIVTNLILLVKLKYYLLNVEFKPIFQKKHKKQINPYLKGIVSLLLLIGIYVGGIMLIPDKYENSHQPQGVDEIHNIPSPTPSNLCHNGNLYQTTSGSTLKLAEICDNGCLKGACVKLNWSLTEMLFKQSFFKLLSEEIETGKYTMMMIIGFFTVIVLLLREFITQGIRVGFSTLFRAGKWCVMGVVDAVGNFLAHKLFGYYWKHHQHLTILTCFYWFSTLFDLKDIYRSSFQRIAQDLRELQELQEAHSSHKDKILVHSHLQTENLREEGG